MAVLNNLITGSPYKGSDKVNSPQAIPPNFAGCKTIAGNAHENSALIRILPVIVGARVREGDPVWHLLLTLKDSVELVVAPVYTAESTAYPDFKISEHCVRFLEFFPDERLMQKQPFLEHYPALIEKYGPLVGVWTMRFDAKHGLQTEEVKSAPVVTKLSTMLVDVLHQDIEEDLRECSPYLSCVQLASTVTYNGKIHSWDDHIFWVNM